MYGDTLSGSSLFTSSNFFFFIKFEHFYEYLIQFPLILGGTKDHFRWAKVPDTAPY